jgi:hypothetical protein
MGHHARVGEGREACSVSHVAAMARDGGDEVRARSQLLEGQRARLPCGSMRGSICASSGAGEHESADARGVGSCAGDDVAGVRDDVAGVRDDVA